MQVEVMQAKIRHAVVTASNIEYRGSLTVDEDILDDMGVLPYQSCDVNSEGGVRTRTYLLPGPRGTGCVEANGNLSLHILKGDLIHVVVFCTKPYDTAKTHIPIVIESNESYIK